MAVDLNISDLFFNYDTSSAKRANPRAEFDGYDEKALAELAQVFLVQLAPICSVELPTVDELVADFFERL